MNIDINRRAAIGELLAIGAFSAIVGCQTTDDFLSGGGKCGDKVPHGAIPQPVGTYACQWQQAQMIRAEQDDFAVYEKEWLEKTAQLSPYGHDHLVRIARRLLDQPYTVVIEPTTDAALNESRRLTLVQFLLEREVPGAEDRIVIGNPAAEGMLGQEAPFIARGYFGTGSQAGSGQASTSNSSGLGGGGFGGGGFF
ncbi:hypothetical protein ETAA8_21140 [Anatilimnocola aggregata]|uniref:Uncharacterized protein n=1 Tax=Anatilimnocola aggregata TaxID=2528021 RepID=A0A517Y9X5_9BACT|nr:hypothetical protein [Anatilimnocola aggregata]QDU27030.1 hypothetical protein ETAA8_21140 [Anatilimnocola aggregata]